VLEDYGVAITPGTDFGEYRSNEFVRLAFTTSMEDLELGVERLAQAVSAHL
jgi:aspartate/methionine/tyrosine aminotransferase